MVTDPYAYPGTNVLKNLAGIEDHAQLERLEAVSTADRLAELRITPTPGAFDTSHLKRIHRHIFQDVYSWAGEFRTIDIRKESEFWFCRHEFIEQSLGDLLQKLAGEKQLTGTTPKEFGPRAGYYMSELNAIHPFREGNGRAQREFIRDLGLNAGLQVDWARVTREEVFAASITSFQSGDHRPFGDLIATITSRLDSP